MLKNGLAFVMFGDSSSKKSMSLYSTPVSLLMFGRCALSFWALCMSYPLLAGISWILSNMSVMPAERKRKYPNVLRSESLAALQCSGL